MDYQGNYFPDEPNENQSKILHTIKSIFKWIMYGISFLIYAIIIYVLFVNRDSKILEKNYIATLPQLQNVDTDDIELYRINAKVFMNEDGSLQLHNIDYSDQYGVMEIGVKYNTNKLTSGESVGCLDYVLYDQDGKTYPLVKIIEDSKGRYGFARICFSDLNIDMESNDLKYDSEKPTSPRTNNLYKLKVLRKSDSKMLYEFTIYDNSVTFYTTDYQN